MTSKSTTLTRTSSHRTNDYLDEIQKIFDQHLESLRKKQQAIVDNIKIWRLEMKEKISKHADAQIDLVISDCQRCESDLNKTRKEYLNQVQTYQDTKEKTRLKELHDACQSLTFQVVILKTCQREYDYPMVVPIEEQEQEQEQHEKEQLENKNATMQKEARRRRRLANENDKKMDNTNDSDASSSHNSVISESNKNKDQQTLDIDSNNQIKNDDDSNEKCPICFMKFSSTMKRHDRNQHVNEHMFDD